MLDRTTTSILSPPHQHPLRGGSAQADPPPIYDGGRREHDNSSNFIGIRITPMHNSNSSTTTNTTTRTTSTTPSTLHSGRNSMPHNRNHLGYGDPQASHHPTTQTRRREASNSRPVDGLYTLRPHQRPVRSDTALADPPPIHEGGWREPGNSTDHAFTQRALTLIIGGDILAYRHVGHARGNVNRGKTAHHR
jgi:hypothetical protein